VWLGHSATVIGLDGIGRLIALQLASFNVSTLQLLDRRSVIRKDQRSEGYDAEDLGRRRVHAVAQACHQINPKLEIIAQRSNVSVLGDVVIFCRVFKTTHSIASLIRDQTVALTFTARATAVRCDMGRGPAVIRKLLQRHRHISQPVLPPPLAHLAAGLAVFELGRFLTDCAAGRRMELMCGPGKLRLKSSH
jgi:hypothetical protein